MFVSAFSSRGPSQPDLEVPAYVRATSEVNVQFSRAGSSTRLNDVFETGGLRIKTPASPHGCDAVVINTAGGMTGGDAARLACRVGPNARVRVTTQSAEKIYRAETTPATIDVTLSLDRGASLSWIPQETILFNHSRLTRSLSVDMAPDAKLVVLETIIFGRAASSESLSKSHFRDRWRIKRAGALIFADDVRLEGNVTDLMERAAAGAGARAVATLLYIAPKAETRLQSVRRALLHAHCDCGASAWNGMVIARFASLNPADVRKDAAHALRKLTGREPPRIWSA